MDKPTVGILSMQRIINYGSFLQAYALRELLKRNGAGDISFIDILPGRSLRHISQKPVSNSLISRILRILKSGKISTGLRNFKYSKRLTASIRSAWPILELDNPRNKSFDYVVIGSDEVFNCCQASPWGYTLQLFGKIEKGISENIFTYAASFGHTCMEDLIKNGIDKEIGDTLLTLNGISTRDQNSKDIIRLLIGKKPYVHIDPVLAYGYKSELENYKDSPCDFPYLIVYTYQGRMNSLSEIRAIKDYAKLNNLSIISIFCRYDWCDEVILPTNPIDVLKWFKHAECIVTDTFHGTIFSIITHSRFATFIRPTNKEKLHSLLAELNLEGQEVEDTSLLGKIIGQTPKYSICEKVLDNYRKETDSYLSAQLTK